MSAIAGIVAGRKHNPRPRIAEESVATFPFVTTSDPVDDDTGVASRPGYDPLDPPSAAITDPMSGLTIFRVGGDNGETLFIDGTTDSGLVFPRRLRNENSPSMQKVWNADGTLLMIDRRFSVSGDASPAATSYLIDVDGNHGASAPWRIVRASGSSGLGDGVGQWWFWDSTNPLRAIAIRDDGSVDEWWPIGGDGHIEGEVNAIRGPITGFSGHNQGRRHMLHTSRDGRFYVSGCQRDSDSRWGGIKIDLTDGSLGPFVPTPDTDPGIHPHPDRSSRGTSMTGLYTSFSPDGNRNRLFNTDTAALVSDTANVDGDGISHNDWAIVDGVEYYVGMRTDILRMFDIEAESYRQIGTFAGTNPQHTGTRNYNDLFETHGAAGGSSTGNRYAIWTRSNPRNGEPRAILGVRMGANDLDVLRYLCNHRSVRTTNANEVHPQIDPDANHIVFPSNWEAPGVETDGDVHPYVLILPDAWTNPNNDGS